MLKDIVERPTGSVASPGPPQPPTPSATGFPTALHRSQRPSAFARARQQQLNKAQPHKESQAVAQGRAVASIPTLETAPPSAAEAVKSVADASEVEELQRTVESDNIRRVEGMTDAERQQEVEELKERFGESIMETMRRRKEAREAREARRGLPGSVSVDGNAQASTSSARKNDVTVTPQVDRGANDAQKILNDAAKENWRKVLAMSETARKGELEELEERFGSNILDALRARAEKRSRKGKERASDDGVPTVDAHPARSTPLKVAQEDLLSSALKQKFFPEVPAEPSKLEWLKPPPDSSTSDNTTRFNLSGQVLSTSAKTSLPTHLGLHHHGSSPDLAGYTLQDILYLCRSTVPSQRITMMGVLTRIISQLQASQDESAYSPQVKRECEEAKVVQIAIKLGVEILAGLTRGVGVIRAGIELLFEALGGPSWRDLEDDEMLTHPFDPKRSSSSESDPTGIAAIPFEDVLPRITELLSVQGGVDPNTVQQLLVVLRRATLVSSDLCETICSIVPTIVHQHVVQKPWPPVDDRYPSIDGLRLLRDITVSSRACAEELLRQGVYETALKFIITATWSAADLQVASASNETAIIGQTLALEVLVCYRALGRYGLGASVVASSPEVWRRLGTWAKDRSTSPPLIEQRVVAAYYDCLAVWITCAIDPHRTTPEHDITWAQISAIGWADEVSAHVAILVKGERWNELASALHVLVAWVAGAQVNAVRAGEDEKKIVLEGLGAAGLRCVILDARDRWKEGEVLNAVTEAVRLHSLLVTGGELLSTEILDGLRQDSYGNVGLHKSATHLLYHLLRLDEPSQSLSPATWLSEAASVLIRSTVGDEPLALDLVDSILRKDWTTGNSAAMKLPTISHPDGLQLLRPLLHYTVLPDVEHIVGPHQVNHLYLKATNTLRSTSSTGATGTDQALSETKERPAGLPLQSDWMFSPLNELLRSGDSIALSQVPPDWEASEPQIVQATLVLAQLILQSSSNTNLDRSSILLNLMKVFMLEHGQHSMPATTETEVFREPSVAQSLEALMAPLTSTQMIDLNETPAALEAVSLPFLGPGVPFYQFYTDFIALYEAISFSEPLFTQLLLPPLAMSYPADYRKLLWNDHSTALRGIRTRLVQVPLESSKGLRAFFEPLEESQEVLHAYARALCRGWVTERNEFIFAVAIHHLAGLFWEGKEENRESARVGLLVMLLSSAADEPVKRVLGWDFESIGRKCVEPKEMERRKEVVRSLTGAKGSARVDKL